MTAGHADFDGAELAALGVDHAEAGAEILLLDVHGAQVGLLGKPVRDVTLVDFRDQGLDVFMVDAKNHNAVEGNLVGE